MSSGKLPATNASATKHPTPKNTIRRASSAFIPVLIRFTETMPAVAVPRSMPSVPPALTRPMAVERSASGTALAATDNDGA